MMEFLELNIMFSLISGLILGIILGVVNTHYIYKTLIRVLIEKYSKK